MRDKVNEEYRYHFMDDCYQTILVKVLPGKRKEDTDTRRLLLKKGMEVIEESVGELGRERVLNIVDGCIYGLFNGTIKEIEGLPRKLKKARLELMRLKDMFEDVQAYIALGKRIGSFQEVMESFRQAETAMQERFYHGGELLLEYSEEGNTSEILKRVVDNSFKKRFLGCIEIMDFEGIAGEIDRVNELLGQSDIKNGSAVAEVYREILSVFYFGTHSFNIMIPDQYNELLEQLELYGRIDEAFRHLKEYFINSLKHWMDEKQYAESRPIRVARQYIAQNYYQPLTLEIVSKEVGFNPTYFSGIFKKETNMNFSEYLKEVRVENAKNMLLNTEQTMGDISIAVGYLDIKYFSRLFKKMTGVTPTEFRKLYN